MSITGREYILQQIRARGRVAEMPPPIWESRRQFDDLASQFTEALTRVKGEVIRAASLEAASGALGDLLTRLNAQRIVANDEAPLGDLDLAGRWPGLEWHIVGRSAGDLRAFCAAADVGLSGADAALAETGSVVVSSGPGKSRLATLLPTVHVALIPESRLTPDIFTWAAARQGQRPANVTLISGPSKTADIEQTLAVGVHGPKRFIVILYGESE